MEQPRMAPRRFSAGRPNRPSRTRTAIGCTRECRTAGRVLGSRFTAPGTHHRPTRRCCLLVRLWLRPRRASACRAAYMLLDHRSPTSNPRVVISWADSERVCQRVSGGSSWCGMKRGHEFWDAGYAHCKLPEIHPTIQVLSCFCAL
jgi:hypothetical protein